MQAAHDEYAAHEFTPLIKIFIKASWDDGPEVMHIATASI